MTRHYPYPNSTDSSFTSDNEATLRSPRQSTINAILQFAEIYPVNCVQYNGKLAYLYDLKN